MKNLTLAQKYLLALRRIAECSDNEFIYVDGDPEDVSLVLADEFKAMENYGVIKCPNCGNENCHSYDNEPLDHSEAFKQYDNEIYVNFRCNEASCKHEFTQTFDLYP